MPDATGSSISTAACLIQVPKHINRRVRLEKFSFLPSLFLSFVQLTLRSEVRVIESSWEGAKGRSVNPLLFAIPVSSVKQEVSCGSVRIKLCSWITAVERGWLASRAPGGLRSGKRTGSNLDTLTSRLRSYASTGCFLRLLLGKDRGIRSCVSFWEGMISNFGSSQV